MPRTDWPGSVVPSVRQAGQGPPADPAPGRSRGGSVPSGANAGGAPMRLHRPDCIAAFRSLSYCPTGQNT